MKYILTEEEKRKIREKYLANVNELNEYLPDNNKISTNLNALNRRLNDPKEQRIYKKGMEIAEKREKRLKICDELIKKYNHLKDPKRNYLLERTLSYFIDERPGSEKYNEAIVKTYYLHPEALAQYAYQKAMELNPADLVKISKCNDSDNLFLDYYEKNRMACDFAFTIKDGYNSKDILSDSAKEYIESINPSYQLFHNSGYLAQRMDETYFTMPSINEDQETLLIDNLGDAEIINDKLSKANGFKCSKDILGEIKKTSKKLEDLKYDYDKPGFFSNYVVKGEDEKYEPFIDNLLSEEEKNAEIIKLDDETVKDLKQFYKKDYISEENFKLPKPLPNNKMAEYLSEFRYRYAMNNNKPIYKLEEQPISGLLKGVRKGFFEFLLRSTSQYTKNLIATLEEFENPKSKDYQNKEKLKEAAEAYLVHRNVKTREDALRQNASAKERSLLCFDIIDSVNATKSGIEDKFFDEIKDDKDDINLINENDKVKNLYINPEEILKDNQNDEINIKNQDFNIKIKEDVKKDDFDASIDNEDDVEIDNNLMINVTKKI